jgi:hypothetical protein
MKLTLTLLATMTVASLAADTPTSILEDYNERATTSLLKINQTLESSAAAVVADLVRAGETALAERVTAQVPEKIAGESVLAPPAQVAQLYMQYDAARIKALKPVQDAAIKRIEAMLRTSDGKQLATVAELGRVRGVIESGRFRKASSSAPAIESGPQNFLRANRIPKKWSYYLSAKHDKKQGTVSLNEDGTLSIDIPSPGTGTWTPTADPTVLNVDIKNAANIPEKTQIIIKGDEATMKRVSGMRFLKAE